MLVSQRLPSQQSERSGRWPRRDLSECIAHVPFCENTSGACGDLLFGWAL